MCRERIILNQAAIDFNHSALNNSEKRSNPQKIKVSDKDRKHF